MPFSWRMVPIVGVCGVCIVVVAIATSATAARRDVPQPLLGADYYATDCHGGPALIQNAPDPTLEREQLFAMHTAGLNSMGLVLNYTTDPNHLNDAHGGAVPIQPDGTLGEPYRTRLITYLTDVRDAGFTDVTLRFQPHGPNSPQPWTSGGYVDDWDPSLYTNDWHFIEDVHGLAKQYGPPQSHFDILAEGPPSDYDRTLLGSRIDDYIKRLYTDYVNAFGNSDVFFSAIDKIPARDDSRLPHLIQDLEATGKPLPNWWGLDIEFNGAIATQNLADAESTLNAYGVSGSLALEETAYEDGPVSAAVKNYNATATHPVVQVEEYPNWGEPECSSAPYTGDTYLRTLGIQTAPLLARVDAKGKPTLTTSDGIPVVALVAGRRYTIVVTDASKKAGFRLTSAGGFRQQTTATFRGSVTWTVGFENPHWTYASYSGRKALHSVSFNVLSPS
jgi:hypothetical protein